MPRSSGYEMINDDEPVTAVPVTGAAANADAEAVAVVDVELTMPAEAAAAAPPTGGFHLRVKRADAPGKPLEVVLPSASSTVARLKAQIEEQTGIPAHRQRLVHRGRMLQDPEVLGTVKHLAHNTIIHLIPRPEDAGVPPVPVSDDEDDADADEDERARRERARRSLAAMTLWGAPAGGDGGEVPVPAGRRRLQVWRARIRLLSSVLFFFYVMSLLSFVALWMQPGRRQKLAELAAKAAGKEADAAAIERYVRRQEMRQLLDMMTSILGVSAGTLGIKAAATLDGRLARRFRSALSVTALCSVGQAALARRRDSAAEDFFLDWDALLFTAMGLDSHVPRIALSNVP